MPSSKSVGLLGFSLRGLLASTSAFAAVVIFKYIPRHNNNECNMAAEAPTSRFVLSYLIVFTLNFVGIHFMFSKGKAESL